MHGSHGQMLILPKNLEMREIQSSKNEIVINSGYEELTVRVNQDVCSQAPQELRRPKH